MPDDLSTKTIMVVDYGLFVELAPRLARDFGKVYYYTPWKSAFPCLADAAVGTGIPGVERIYDLWRVADDVDLWVFPDVYDADLQAYLRSQGRRVWGSGGAQFLELDRWRCRQTAADLGIHMPAARRIVGLERLRDHLESVHDKWVKVSTFRGDMETFHHVKPFTSRTFLDVLAGRYGPLANQVEFIVEQDVPGIELGYDGHTIDGQFPQTAFFGYEIKDSGYVMKSMPYADLPSQVTGVHDALAPVLRDGQCRSYVSFETRVTKEGKPYLLDPCMRSGSPPTEIWMEVVGNLAEVMWYGASGEMVEPKPIAPYQCMAMIHSQFANKHWVPVSFPSKYRRWVKFRNLAIIDGHSYFVPQRSELPELGAVVGIGDSLEEAIDMMDEIAAQVDGYDLDIHNHSMVKAREAIEQGKAMGIHF